VTRPIRVLHLEDSPRDAEVLHETLKTGGVSATIVLVNSKERFEAALAANSFDIILSDYNVPGYDGIAAVKLAQEKQPETPVIVVSGTMGEEDAVKCLHVGATDYLLKQRLERLVPAVQRAIQDAEERRRRKEAEQALLQRERRLSSIYETVSDSLFYVDVEEDGRYRFTSVNQAFVSTTGLNYNQVVGKRVDEVIPEPSLTLMLEKYGEAIREKRVVRWEETSEYPKGRLTGEVSIAPVFDDVGSCTHLVGAVHDVTERRQLEAQFRQAQR
jgi:PAS domain S-box-containing protein